MRRRPQRENEPRIGQPSTPGDTCQHASREGDPTCPEPATVHVAVALPDATALVALASCDRHVHVARLAGSFFAEHPFDPAICGGTRTEWAADHSRCIARED